MSYIEYLTSYSQIPRKEYYLDDTTNITLMSREITQIISMSNLDRLQNLNLGRNKISKIECLESLTNLKYLFLFENQITSIKGLDHLVSLELLDLSRNKITKMENLENLTNLQYISINGNNITEIPYTIMNHRDLFEIIYDHDKINLNPIIKRFLQNNKFKTNRLSVYNDSQNIHDSSINKSMSESIYLILNTNMSFDMVLKDILHDHVLTNLTKDALVEYSNMENVHSTLNVTFKEVLQSVWYIIKNHKDSDQIKNILNEEMKDSLCKCFTGRLSRLVNCLNGFDDRVTIKISDSNEISNIIVLIRNKYSNIEDQKREIIKEMKERNYNNDVINEWLGYL